MRILLRNEETGLYYVHPEGWTEHSSLAYNFHSGGRATDVALRLGLTKGVMHFQFDDPELDFSIQIPSLANRT